MGQNILMAPFMPTLMIKVFSVRHCVFAPLNKMVVLSGKIAIFLRLHGLWCLQWMSLSLFGGVHYSPSHILLTGCAIVWLILLVLTGRKELLRLKGSRLLIGHVDCWIRIICWHIEGVRPIHSWPPMYNPTILPPRIKLVYSSFSTGNENLIVALIVDNTDVPIAIRKRVMTCSQHPISKFVSYNFLCSSYCAFVLFMSSVSIP